MPRLFAFTMAAMSLAASAATTEPAQPDASREEVALTKVQSETLTAIVEACGVAYPELKEGLDKELSSWRDSNDPRLRTMAAWTSALPEDRQASLQKDLDQARSFEQERFRQRRQSGDGETYCRNAVSEIGSAERRRLPEPRNYDMAAVMYAVTIQIHDREADACFERAPAVRDEVERAKASWEKRDRVVREHALARVPELDPVYSKALQTSIESLDPLLESLQTMTPKTLADWCHERFSAIADGEDRRQSPKIYEFLESGPGPGTKP